MAEGRYGVGHHGYRFAILVRTTVAAYHRERYIECAAVGIEVSQVGAVREGDQRILSVTKIPVPAYKVTAPGQG